MKTIYMLNYIQYGHKYNFYRNHVELLSEVAYTDEDVAKDAAKGEFQKRNHAAWQAQKDKYPQLADYMPERIYNGVGAGAYEGFAISVVSVPLNTSVGKS